MMLLKIAGLTATLVLSAGLGLAVGAMADEAAPKGPSVETVDATTETDTPETETPETEDPETEDPETDEPETDAPETDAPGDAAPYGQALKAWKTCVAEVEEAADCGLRPRPKGHAHGWDKNGFGDGTKVTGQGKPDKPGKSGKPEKPAKEPKARSRR